MEWKIAHLKTRHLFAVLYLLRTGITTMSYHHGSYQPETHHQASLPQNLALYRGPQDIYSNAKGHSREIHSVTDMNAGLQMVPPPQYPVVQHAPVYHHAAPQPFVSSSQYYPLEAQLQPQHASSRYVDHRLGFDLTNPAQRNICLPPPLPPLNYGPQPQLHFAQSAPKFDLGNSHPTFYPGLGFRPNNVAVPLSSNSRQFQPPPDINVLDGLPPLKRKQGRFAHSNPLPRWEPKKAQTVKPRPGPQSSLSTKRKGAIKGSNRDWSTLRPGAVHILIPITSSLPSPPLDRYFQDAATPRDPVMYLPRSSGFSGKDKDPRACISFSVDGLPGPYLLELAEGRVTVDAEDDKIFEQFGWRTTKLQIDVCTLRYFLSNVLVALTELCIQWPGLYIPPEGLKVHGEDGLPLRRGELAAVLATRIAKMIINTQRGYPLVSFFLPFFFVLFFESVCSQRSYLIISRWAKLRDRTGLRNIGIS